MKKISIPEESYWKLLELKARFHCKTWKELIDLLYRRNVKGVQLGAKVNESVDQILITPITRTIP